MEELQIHDNNNLLAEIRAELMRQSAFEKERLLFQKLSFFGIVLIVAMLVAAAVYIVPPFQTTIRNIGDVTKTLSEADVDGMVADVQKLAQDSGAAFASVGETVSMLDDVDIETLNSAIGKLDAAADQFSTFDVASLNEAITNLNASVEPLAKFFGVFKKTN